MKRNTISALLLIASCGASYASTPTSEEEVTFSAKPIVTIFENFHQGFGDNSDVSTYEHVRGYVGYGFKAKGGWSGQFVFDLSEAEFSEQDRLEFTADLKSLQLNWNSGGLTLSGGIIKTNNFGLKESAWGYRYVMASFEDLNKFAPSADLGLSAEYRFNSKVSLDVSATNGKGHRELIFTDNYRYGVGATFNPTKELTMRAFYDHYCADSEGERDQIGTSLFVGYKVKEFSLGVEYSQMMNRSFNSDANAGGGSVYGTYYLNDKLNIFARYDLRTTTNESIFESGNLFRGGVEYRPLKLLRISPNIVYEDLTLSGASTYFYLNFQIKI